ncbi:hypothetical protein QOZ80_7AG0577500 [Eleusine coracana subsp. coracana]|nr:hypothetical protein QOZ80_7AG0577500 [Eleusine coracana subsp. coracana]
MPATRRRAAAAAPVLVVVEEDDEERAAAIDISSDFNEESEPSSEEEETSDEDFIEISDSDSAAGDGEGSSDESEEEGEAEADAEAEAEQFGADRSEAACSKIVGLLSNGRSLEGIKLVECKAYLKKIGLSQTGDVATCIDRIMLHWRLKDGNPEKIYPRSSFCINCKGDVCRSDVVLFKQKVYEKSGKKHAKCIGKRVVAGKVIKESYGKEKQQHTFTIQVFWSRGVGKLPPLHLLLVKGRNLYRMMTFRQPWPNEAERLKVLEEKHNRGDVARRVRSLSRHKSAGNTLKGKKTLEKEKHQARSNITEGKKRSTQSSNFDMPNKWSKKEGGQLLSIGKRTSGGKAKKNHVHFDKSIRTGSREKLQRNCHLAPLNAEVGMSKRKPRSEQRNNISQFQFEGRSITLSHVQANREILAGIHNPFFERHQGAPPLREVGNIWLPHPGVSSVACPNGSDELFNSTMGFHRPNATSHAPLYVRQSNQQRRPFPSSGMPETAYYPHPEVSYSYGVPHFRYPRGGGAGFRR